MLAGGVGGVLGLFDGFSLVVLELEPECLCSFSQHHCLFFYFLFFWDKDCIKKKKQDQLFCFLDLSPQEYAKC